MMLRRSLPLLALPMLLAGASACLGDVEVPPDPPTLFPLQSPTRSAMQRVEGTKPKGTAVLNFGEQIVAHDDQESWSFPLDLVPGQNRLDLTSQLESGLESRDRTLGLIVFEPNFPAQPTLDPFTSPTNQPQQSLSGSRPTRTSLELRWLDAQRAVTRSVELVALGEEETWSAPLQLDGADGLYRFSLVALDDRGQASEPLDFQIELDRTAPALASRYPAPGMTDVPTNALISAALDGALAIAVDQVDADTLTLADAGGSPQGGVVNYQPFSFDLLRAAALQPSSTYTVLLDASRFTDAAGNQTSPQPADWSWSFTTGTAELVTAPGAPTATLPATVDPASGRTFDADLALSGQKEAWTSIWINGSEVVPIDDQTSWSYAWPLGVGENTLRVEARNAAGVGGPFVEQLVTRELRKPAPPVVEPAPPATVDAPLLTLAGSKEAETAILYNGNVVIPRNPETTWAYNADLLPGVNEIELRARNAEGVLSDPVTLVIDFAQVYDGPVEAGFKLLISFSLRDLAGIDPISASFDTGSNHYAAEIWIEGPLEPGETCRYDASTKQRTDIDYVATVVHYVGSGEGSANPFWDADYRAPDYLAALVSGGVFEGIGIPASADRRDDTTGYQGGDLVDGTGRIRIGTQDLQEIDGVTEATIPSGLQVYEWLPLTPDFQRIQQGEYLINVLLHLDRDPGWVSRNDYETCWGDDDFSEVGQHRIVRRMGLGTIPYTVSVGQAGERAAPDNERGADQLRYLTGDGITLRWIKE